MRRLGVSFQGGATAFRGFERRFRRCWHRTMAAAKDAELSTGFPSGVIALRRMRHGELASRFPQQLAA